MTYCSICKDDKDLVCCDFCLYSNHESWWDSQGKLHTGSPVSCNLHLDKEHEEIADNNGVCEDFHCFREPHEEPMGWKILEGLLVCPHCETDFDIYVNEADKFHYCPNCGRKVVD